MRTPGPRIEKKAVVMPGTFSMSAAVFGQRRQLASDFLPKP
jgi:hypothetical protein